MRLHVVRQCADAPPRSSPSRRRRYPALADSPPSAKQQELVEQILTLSHVDEDAMKSAGEELQEKFLAIARQVQEEQQRRRPSEQTMADMRVVATAAESWAVDHDDLYPPSTTWAELRKELEPTYIKELPLKDGWGNDFVWIVSQDRKHYRIVSAGADKAFDADSRRIAAPSKEVKLSDRLEDDIVYADGMFVQAPRASKDSN